MAEAIEHSLQYLPESDLQDIATYLREIRRSQGLVGSVYDSNVTAFDPFPWSPRQESNDPLLDSLIAPTTSAMVDFVTREVGWKTDARYNALSYAVNAAWDRGQPADTPVTSDNVLRAKTRISASSSTT